MKKELINKIEEAMREELESGIVPFQLEYSMERFDDMAYCIQQFEQLLLKGLNSANEATNSQNNGAENKAFRQYHYEEFLGGHLRHGFFISMMGAIESILDQVCYSVGSLADTTLRLKDLNGSVVQKSKKYLDVIGGFNRPADSSWELLGYFYTLRNVLIHAGGYAKGKNARRLKAL